MHRSPGTFSEIAASGKGIGLGVLLVAWLVSFFSGIEIFMVFLLLLEHGSQLSTSRNTQISAKK